MAKKVIVRVKGGLGNQLFCYAVARRLAIANQAELVIDHVSGFVRDLTYRRKYALDPFKIPVPRATPYERMEPFERYRRGWAKYIARRRAFHLRRYVEQEGIDFDERLLAFKVERTVYLDGLWQSADYFKDVEQTIRSDLEIIPPQDTANLEMARRISACDAVALHVRWFNIPGRGATQHNAPPDYYHRAVAEIDSRVGKPHFFLFSDDPASAMRMLGLTEDRATCVDHNRGDGNAYADLWLMSLCKHFIIANSTFSWWGAWLSAHPAKVVIVPAMVSYSGVCGWGFKGLIPDEWMQIEPTRPAAVWPG